MLTLDHQEITRHTNRSISTTERIQIIAMRFHCLERLPFVRKWDAIALDQWALVASHGERCAAQFVLSVWNCFDTPRCGKFDVIEAFNVWDTDHRAAFLAWALNPVNC